MVRERADRRSRSPRRHAFCGFELDGIRPLPWGSAREQFKPLPKKGLRANPATVKMSIVPMGYTDGGQGQRRTAYEEFNMPFTYYTLDTFVAPDLSKFTDAEIPDLTAMFPQAPHWVGNHFLNNVFGGQFDPPIRQIVLGIVRRAYAAFKAFHQARKATLDYVEGIKSGRQPIRIYFEALDHWEMFALSYVMVVDLFRKLGGGRNLFGKHDGSLSFRLYSIGNKIKHLNHDEYRPTDTVPLWLSNTGLLSFGLAVTFPEAADELRQVAEMADRLQNPRGFVEWLQENKPQ
jgi:hypothetical protein